MLLIGGISSTEYAIEYGETQLFGLGAEDVARSRSIMCIGIFLMLLQACREFFKDIARIRRGRRLCMELRD